MDFERCPSCRKPLQGIVCKCGLDVREAEIVRCHDCGERTTESESERVPRGGSRIGSRPELKPVCPDCLR